MSSISGVKPARILLVSRRPSERARFGSILLAAGYAVHTAGHGAGALQQMLAEPAELLLLDVDLPDMPGLQLCQLVRARFGPRPVIFMSDQPGGLALRLIDGLPLVRFLPKPVQSEILLAALDALRGEAAMVHPAD